MLHIPGPHTKDLASFEMVLLFSRLFSTRGARGTSVGGLFHRSSLDNAAPRGLLIIAVIFVEASSILGRGCSFGGSMGIDFGLMLLSLRKSKHFTQHKCNN